MIKKTTISIVVPVRNETDLRPRIEKLARDQNLAEIIVVDTSARPSIVGTVPARVIHAPQLKTRAEAMNEGARCAAGDVFLFLHADCELPEEALAVIEEMIGRGLDGGAFLKTYRPALLLLRLQALVLNHLARTRNRPVTGTNAIFVRRDRFAIWGGFREVPFCEDILMWDRLLAQGKATVVGKNVVVSSRRYRRFWGIPRVAWNGLIYVLFRLGVPLAVLKRFYGG